MKNLRVGIIGVHAERGWARDAHVPAVRALGGLELVAVATRSQESADAAGAVFGVDRAYGEATDLIADPDVDIVTVAASVPSHRDLLAAAVDAGKHVVTEWPVGVGTAQTEEIAAIVGNAGVQGAVGLQARMNPAAARACELVGSGAVGRVLSATVYSSTAGFGRVVSDGALYLEKPETGMNLPTIQAAHTVDLAVWIAGPLTSVAAQTTTQYPQLAVGEAAKPYPRVLPDHVLVHGRLAGGGALAVQVVGGRPVDDTPFRMDVVGEEGTLTLRGGAPRGFQSGVLALSWNGRPVDVDGGEAASLPAPVVNVAWLYTALRDDIRTGTRTVPIFGDAVRLSHLIDDVLVSAAEGRTVTL